jgi:cell division protein FtsL
LTEKSLFSQETLIKKLLQQKQPSEHEQAMSKLRVVLTALIIAVLFVSAIAGTIFYYNGVVDRKNSEIASLNTQLQQQNNEIANLTSQISSLNQKITNLTTANLVSSLAIKEVAKGYNYGGTVPYNHLMISGSVTNVGQGTAYNAGLQVMAYASDGTKEINMTVPLLERAVYPTDNATSDFVGTIIGVSSRTLGYLIGNSSVYITEIDIYHEGVVANWTVMPIWTNSP